MYHNISSVYSREKLTMQRLNMSIRVVDILGEILSPLCPHLEIGYLIRMCI